MVVPMLPSPQTGFPLHSSADRELQPATDRRLAPVETFFKQYCLSRLMRLAVPSPFSKRGN